jgi:hypothetical protein
VFKVSQVVVEHGWQAGQAVQEEQTVHVVEREGESWQTVQVKIEQGWQGEQKGQREKLG